MKKEQLKEIPTTVSEKVSIPVMPVGLHEDLSPGMPVAAFHKDQKHVPASIETGTCGIFVKKKKRKQKFLPIQTDWSVSFSSDYEISSNQEEIIVAKKGIFEIPDSLFFEGNPGPESNYCPVYLSNNPGHYSLYGSQSESLSHLKVGEIMNPYDFGEEIYTPREGYVLVLFYI